MKYLLRLTLLVSASVFIILGGCKNKLPTNILPANPDTANKCSNQVLAALITPGDLQTIINTSGFTKVYMQFKTTDDHSFYPAAYFGSFPYTDVSSSLTPLNLSSPFLPNKPYIFGNLEWKFPSGFTPDMSIQYYCLLPAMSDDGVHVTYTYIKIPSTFQYKDSSLTVDTSFIAHNSNKEQLDSLTLSAMKSASSGFGGSINPVPPKKPE